MTGEVEIAVNVSPTEEDYHYARRAHGIWAQVRAKGSGRHAWLGQIISLITVITVGGGLLLPNFVSFRPWLVRPVGVLIPMLLYPTFVLFAGLWAWAFAGKLVPVVDEIAEHVITDKGGFSVKQNKTARPWLFQVIFSTILFFVVLYALRLMRGRSLFSTTVDNATEAVTIPSTALIMGSFVSFLIAGIVYRSAQRARLRTKMILTKFPALLLPRRWEFGEDFLAERSHLLESRMKWEYIQKFLETPRVVLLYPNDDAFYFIAKAAFSDELQFARFMGLLMRKVPRGIRQPQRPVGFEVLSATPALRVISD